MNIIFWIILGGLAGWIASMIMGTNARQGLFKDILLGVIGAVVGGFAFSLFGGAGITGFNFYSLFVAILGSVAVIWVGKRFYSF